MYIHVHTYSWAQLCKLKITGMYWKIYCFVPGSRASMESYSWAVTTVLSPGLGYRYWRRNKHQTWVSMVSYVTLLWITVYNPSNIFAHARLVWTHHVGKYSPAKTGEYPRIFPNFQNWARCIKDLKDNKHSSLHLGENMLGYYTLDIICSS